MSYTLRDLPLPVKVVASVFLMSVGVGYASAMVQLHMQDAKAGKALPTKDDVVIKYTGKKWFDADPPRPVSKLERLIMGSTDANAVFNGTGSMGPAFFSKDPSSGPKKYTNLLKATPDKKAEIDAQREGERQVFKAWINTPDEERRKAYESDNFVPPQGQEPKAIDNEWKKDNGFKIKSIIETRCVACHSKDGPQDKYPLETYEQLTQEKYTAVPVVPAVPPGGGWVKIEEPISIDKLTQTTHTHLLSFAMLFSLTGVIFAFSSYWKIVRVIIGPWVTLAVVVDVSCWWLARMCDQWGPFFAQAIMVTGGLAGIGLAIQITGSLFNMYGWKGKIVVALLFALGAGIAGAVIENKIKPALDEKQNPPKKPDPVAPPPKNGDPKPGGPKDPPKTEASRLDQVLMWPVKVDGKEKGVNEVPFKGDKDAGMIRAFFDRDEDGTFKAMMKDKEVPQEEKDALIAKRHGELAAFKAWLKTAEPQRKAAYEADAFELPADLKEKPITDDYIKDGKAKVKSIIDARCARCHIDGSDREPLDSYEGLAKAMKLPAVLAKGEEKANGARQVKVAEPIPLAKDD